MPDYTWFVCPYCAAVGMVASSKMRLLTTEEWMNLFRNPDSPLLDLMAEHDKVLEYRTGPAANA